MIRAVDRCNKSHDATRDAITDHCTTRERPVHHVYNGMAATELRGVAWQKSRYSNSQGACVEFAALPGGEVAVRNSRDPEGPALVYTRAEIEAMLLGIKDGEFDHLVAGG
jgi:hypothetical protein